MILIVWFGTTGYACGSMQVQSALHEGPYVDELVFNVIEGFDQQALALQNGDIDLIGDDIPHEFVETLETDEDINVTSRLRNGYGYVSINTVKYPLNITAFRRAVAFALDKETISNEIWNGYSVPLDSCVPKINPFSIEGQLSYSYYGNDSAYGNQLLDSGGFLDVDDDGVREAPDGSDFSVLIEYSSSSSIAEQICNEFADTLSSLRVNASAAGSSYPAEYKLYYHEDYDMIFTGASFSGWDVDWLAYAFWSEYAEHTSFWNYPNFRNATYDSYREQLLYSVDYDDVYTAAIEMQRIWVYECPEIVCYENQMLSAYRTDRYEGHMTAIESGAASWWTKYLVRLKESHGGPIGGTFRVSNSLDIETLNFMITSSSYTWNVLEMIYDPLFREGPDGSLIPWMVSDYSIDSVQPNTTRIVVDLHEDLLWSDGSSLTSEDAARTFQFYRDAPGHPYGSELTDLSQVLYSGSHRFILEFNSSSYWHFTTVARMPLLPKEVLDAIGEENWNTWNPRPEDGMVTSGPFVVSEHAVGEYVSLVPNRYYFRLPRSHREIPVSSSASTIEIEHGMVGGRIQWNINRAGTYSYWIYHNGTVVDEGSTSTDYIRTSLDGLELGQHNFTLRLREEEWAIVATDTVWVHVYSENQNEYPLTWLLHPVSTIITVLAISVMVYLAPRVLRAREGVVDITS
ncbi:hypothetical protein EU538_02755 [Candidatus Thorarchaeota archaeon]|nr:MAG: hypothetical protein EU538_02755 [Candidatus Thorarchaeota archaeon]